MVLLLIALGGAAGSVLRYLGLIEGGEYSRAMSYIALSLTLCLAATFAGMTVMRLVSGTGHAR